MASARFVCVQHGLWRALLRLRKSSEEVTENVPARGSGGLPVVSPERMPSTSSARLAPASSLSTQRLMQRRTSGASRCPSAWILAMKAAPRSPPAPRPRCLRWASRGFLHHLQRAPSPYFYSAALQLSRCSGLFEREYRKPLIGLVGPRRLLGPFGVPRSLAGAAASRSDRARVKADAASRRRARPRRSDRPRPEPFVDPAFADFASRLWPAFRAGISSRRVRISRIRAWVRFLLVCGGGISRRPSHRRICVHSCSGWLPRKAGATG